MEDCPPLRAGVHRSHQRHSVVGSDGATIEGVAFGRLFVRTFRNVPMGYAVGDPEGAQRLSISTAPTKDLEAVTLLYPLARAAALPDPGFEMCATLLSGDPRCPEPQVPQHTWGRKPRRLIASINNSPPVWRESSHPTRHAFDAACDVGQWSASSRNFAAPSQLSA